MRNRIEQQGFSLIELLIVVALIGIIASIAIPNVLTSRRAANEGSAESSMRTIQTAQATYLSTAGSGQYGTLATLGAQNLIDGALTNGAKSGYTFTCSNSNLAVNPSRFYATGVPGDTGLATRSGSRSFTIAEDGVLRGKTSDTGPADHTEAMTDANWPPINQ